MQHALIENNSFKEIDCLMIGVFEDEKTPPAIIQTSSKIQDFYEKHVHQLTSEQNWAYQSNGNESCMILFQLGKRNKYNADSLKQSLKKIIALFKNQNFKSLCLSFPHTSSLPANDVLKISLLTLEQSYYQFDRYKSKASTPKLEKIYYDIPASSQIITETIALWEGIKLCQDLGNTPANDCTPIDLEETAKKMSKEFPSLKFSSLDVPAMKALGMNTLLSVGQGSQNPPRLVELHYQQGQNQKPLIIIGKGITFDSGGISLKPADPMFEMKYDMCGAASVLGTMKAIALLNLPVNVIGIIACAENMPSGTATRPGDVVKSHLGKTVEIINTDAEGRLVLADAISYSKQYQPKAIVDIATLTGAIIVALGSVYTGLMSNNDKLSQSLINAGKKAFDKIWALPMDDEYKEFLYSPVADLANANLSRVAGSITAAHFLEEFAEETPWAHLDIAGSAWISGKNRQATGRPVGLLLEWIKSYHDEKI